LNGSKSHATAKLVYVINQWPNPFGQISNPPAFGVIYSIKYSGGFRYFTSHNIKIGLKMWQHYHVAPEIMLQLLMRSLA
jgi:hypothetical protein